MIKLKNIINENSRNKTEYLNSGRSISLTEKDFLKIYHAKCVKLTNAGIIYRYILNFSDEYGIVDPKSSSHKRVSAFAEYNYYTLLLDNLPSWKEYPKRSESIICTTNKYEALNRTFEPKASEVYYIVIPFTGAKLAICPSNDIWYSFEENMSEYLNDKDLADFLDILEDSFEKYKIKMDNTYESLLKLGQAIDKNPKFFGDRNKYGIFIEMLESGTKFMNILDIMFYPAQNGFKLKNAASGIRLPKDNELWTSDKCLLIRYDIFRKMKSEKKL